MDISLEAGTSRVERSRALVSKSPNLLDLAGAVAVPPDKRGMPWDEVLRRSHAELARRRR